MCCGVKAVIWFVPSSCILAVYNHVLKLYDICCFLLFKVGTLYIIYYQVFIISYIYLDCIISMCMYMLKEI